MHPTTYALSFAVPMDTPGLIFLCRDSAATVGSNRFDHPLSSRFDEQDAFAIFDDVEVPRERVFIDGDIDVYNSVMGPTAWWANIMQQTTIRALTKLEFAYGLALRMAEAVNDISPTTIEMLGELSTYVEVTRSADPAVGGARLRPGRRRHLPRWPADAPDALDPGGVVPEGARDPDVDRQPQPARRAQSGPCLPTPGCGR